MFLGLKRYIVKTFRELLVYHNSSLEYRAKILTLMVSSNHTISECEEDRLKEIASIIYKQEPERGVLLVETVKEYHEKIVTNNGLDFEHLVLLVEKETKEVKRFVHKIEIPLLLGFHECLEDEEEKIFQQRVLEFLENLKEEYGGRV